MTASFHIFETALGRCALAWSEVAIVAAALPDRDDGRLLAAIRSRTPGAQPATPSALASEAMDRVAGLLAGRSDDLADIPLDLSGVSAFEAAVYTRARAIPPGGTRTYGAIAADLGEPGAARAVGTALGRNPFPPIVPCHRVLAARGGAGGFSAPGGLHTKRRLLEIERARTSPDPSLFDHFGVEPGRSRR